MAALQQARAQLKRYRQSVLQAAVTGELTREWREKFSTNKSSIEYSKLPEGWEIKIIEKIGTPNEQIVLTGPFGASLGTEDFVSSGVPILTIGCLTGSGIDLKKAKYISPEKSSELERYKVRSGDLLFSRMATVGRAEIVSSKYEGAVINYHLMRLRLSDKAINPKYFIFYVRGSKVVVDYIKEVNHGATRDGINTSQLLNLPVILPPISEQNEIVDEVERRLSVMKAIDQSIEQSLLCADHLRQSILQQAFSGKLI